MGGGGWRRLGTSSPGGGGGRSRPGALEGEKQRSKMCNFKPPMKPPMKPPINWGFGFPIFLGQFGTVR